MNEPPIKLNRPADLSCSSSFAFKLDYTHRNATDADIVTSLTNHALLPPTSQRLLYDLDRNQTSDNLWTNTWNAENRG